MPGTNVLISQESALHLSIGHPLFDYTPVKMVVAADLKNRNLTPVNQFVERASMNPEILGHFGSRHDPAVRGSLAELHACVW